MWHQIAARLNIPKQELQRKTTSSEFMDWWFFLQWEFNNPSRNDFYLMQIAQEVHCVLMKRSDRKKFKLKDFLIKLVFGKKEEKPEPVRNVQLENIDNDETLSEFEKMLLKEEEEKRLRAEAAAKQKAAWARIFPPKEKK